MSKKEKESKAKEETLYVQIKTNWYKSYCDFKKIDDIEKMVGFLHDIIDDLKVCNNKDCNIWPSIWDLEARLDDFPQKTPEEATLKIENSVELGFYLAELAEFKIKAKRVLHEIFVMKELVDKQKKDQQDKLDSFLKVLDKFNENDQDYPQDFTQNVKSLIDGFGDVLDPSNPVIQRAKSKMMRQSKDDKKKGD